MTEIIERIVKSEGVPSKNDLWLKKDGDNLTLNAHDNGEWKQVSGPGGGPAGGAVSYNEQTLTEAQQMQARKNQGLYYKETTQGGTITWDGNTSGKESFADALYKVADTPTYLAPSSWRSVTLTSVIRGQEPTETEMPIEQEAVTDVSSEFSGGRGYAISMGHVPIVLVAENLVANDIILNGVYFLYQEIEEEATSGYGYASSFTYAGEDIVNQIPFEYIPDLTIYAEIEGGSSQPVIKSGTHNFSDFVNALKGGPGSPKFVIYDSNHNKYYINQTFSLDVEYALEGGSNTVTISTLLQDGNNTVAGITANFDSEDHYTNISAYILGNA